MWRPIVLASLLSLLALGTAAYADCASCLTSVFASRSGTSIGLSFTAHADDGSALPEVVTAVVMQVDGQRTKCLTVPLRKTAEAHGAALYSGTFTAYGQASHSGRVDLAGQIYEFTVPLDGTAGKVALAADQSPLPQNRFVVQVTAAPATPAPTAAPAPRENALTRVLSLATEPTALLGAAVVLLTFIGAYVDRRRSLARHLAG